MGEHSPSSRYNIGMWRRRLRDALTHVGTWEAVAALERIYHQMPTLVHAYALRDGREAAWRTHWSPPSPSELLRTLGDREVRIVRSADDLMRVLNESLSRFQGELTGTSPLVRLLWYPVGKYWRPRDEGDLADAIDRHFATDLRKRGIVAGRELVIRRGAGDGVRGSRTDLTVFAVVPGSSENAFDSIVVILEVKCSWNDELTSAIDEQLVGDYLINNPRARHGIYVAGWYDSPLWDGKDSRHSRNYRQGFAALRRTIRRQARVSSSSGEVSIVADVLDVSLQQNAKRPALRAARAKHGRT